MLKKMMSRLKKNEKGFTLIELLAVLVILGIIAAIAVPVVSGVISRSKVSADNATAKQIYDAARLYVNQEHNGNFTSRTVTIGVLQANRYIDNGLALPSTKEQITDGSVTFDANGILTNVILTTATNSRTFAGTNILSSNTNATPSLTSPSPTP